VPKRLLMLVLNEYSHTPVAPLCAQCYDGVFLA
jgi:hypothetical protein